jgi:hypothetical protein
LAQLCKSISTKFLVPGADEISGSSVAGILVRDSASLITQAFVNTV